MSWCISINSIKATSCNVVIIIMLMSGCLFEGANASHIAENILFLSSPEMDPGRVFVLKVLPTGEIIDPYIQLTTAGGNSALTVSPNNKFLLAGAGGTINRYRIEANGDIVPLGVNATGTPVSITITPNNELVSVAFGGIDDEVFQLSSTGDLIDTYHRLTIGRYVNPRGNPFLDMGYPNYALWAFHLDYDALTTYRTAVIDNIAGNYVKIAYTPDGSIGLMTGYLPLSIDCRVLKIDTTENVTTTGQYWDFGLGPVIDVKITPNGRYGFIAIDSSVVILAIDTITGTVTDTGTRWRPPISWFTPGYLQISADGKFLVIDYWGTNDYDWITSAIIGVDGSLTWTGYTFPFGNTYIPGSTAVTNMAMVPIYVTGVDSEWLLYE